MAHEDRTGERGAAATEYALLVTAIAVVLAAALGYVGAELASSFGSHAKIVAHHASAARSGT